MLLVQPRIALLHLCLAVMQAAWIAPFVLLVYGGAASPLQIFVFILALLLVWMLVLELLSRWLESPAYDGVSLILMFVTSLVLVRLLLYGNHPAWDLGWLGEAVRDTANYDAGLPPAVVIIGANLLLWQRATAATSRDVTFFGVGMTFRVGMLLLILGGGLYAVVRGGQLIPYIWVYFAAGLVAVSLARIGEKAVEAQSSGPILPARRFMQILAAIGVTLGVGWLASAAYTPGGIRSFLHLLDPLWRLIRPLLLALLILIGKLLTPALLWLESLLTRMLRQPGAGEDSAAAAASSHAPSPLANLPSWPFELIRSALVLALIVGAVLGLLVFLLLYLDRVRKVGRRDEAEEEDTEPGTFGGGLVGRGLHAMRRAVRLTRRLGIGRQLLAAISVQNMYANLMRIAARHGRARRPAQPPDDFLPVLDAIFPGEEAPLARLTAAYMRVHYGDQPVRTNELADLRDDYRAIRAAEVERS